MRDVFQGLSIDIIIKTQATHVCTQPVPGLMALIFPLECIAFVEDSKDWISLASCCHYLWEGLLAASKPSIRLCFFDSTERAIRQLTLLNPRTIRQLSLADGSSKTLTRDFFNWAEHQDWNQLSALDLSGALDAKLTLSVLNPFLRRLPPLEFLCVKSLKPGELTPLPVTARFLDISNMKKLTHAEIFALLRNQTNLTGLVLRGCFRITLGTFHTLICLLPFAASLQYLDLTGIVGTLDIDLLGTYFLHFALLPPTAATHFPGLTDLHIGARDRFETVNFASISKMTNLRSLNMKYSEEADYRPLALCPALRVLALQAAPIHDAELLELTEARQWEELDLRDCLCLTSEVLSD